MLQYNPDTESIHITDLLGSVRAIQLVTYNAIRSEMLRYNINGYIDQQEPNVHYYSLQSKYTFAPCVFIKTKNDNVVLCRGVNFSRPKNYMRQVIEFIIGQNMGIDADMACTGIVRQNDKYYNVYDLPKGFTYQGNMDLSNAGLICVPNMSTVTIKGDYNISQNKLVTFYGIPKEVFGDFYAYKNENMRYTNHCPRNIIIHGKYYSKFPDKWR